MAQYSSANALGELTVQVAEGRGFEKKSFLCTLKLHKVVKQTPPSAKSPTPKWNTSYDFLIFEEDMQLQVQVYFAKKKFCIGEVVIALEPLKSLEVTTITQWHKLKGVSHVEQGGEIRLIIRYNPLRKRKATTSTPLPMSSAFSGESGANEPVLLVHHMRRGPQTWYERMEQAVLEERDFLSNELTRITRTYGSESQKATTVRDMLTTLERSARELKLDVAQQIGPQTSEAEAQRLRPELAGAIEDLESKSVRRQREALILLSTYLKTEDDLILFSRCGGARALLSLLSSPHQPFTQKALEHLQDISFDDRARSGFDCLDAVKSLAPILRHPSKDVRVLASCVFTNLILDSAPRVQQWINRSEGLHTLVSLFDIPPSVIENESTSYMCLRMLWALSNIHLSVNAGRREMIEEILQRMKNLLGHPNDDVRAKAAMVLSNVASVEDNLSLLHLHRASWLSALERLIANKGSRGLEQPKSVVLQALRALTNVSAHPELQQEIVSHKETIENIVFLVRYALPGSGKTLKRAQKSGSTFLEYSSVRRQAAWTCANLCVGADAAKALADGGVYDALLSLLICFEAPEARDTSSAATDSSESRSRAPSTAPPSRSRGNSLNAATALGIRAGASKRDSSTPRKASVTNEGASAVVQAASSVGNNAQLVLDTHATFICALRAIGNLALVGSVCRTFSKSENNGFNKIVDLIEHENSEVQRACLETIANMCGTPEAQLAMFDMDAGVKIMKVLTSLCPQLPKPAPSMNAKSTAEGMDDEETAVAAVAAMACVALARYIHNSDAAQQEVLREGAIEVLSRLLEVSSGQLSLWLRPALRALANFNVEDDTIRNELISSGCLPALAALLRAPDEEARAAARRCVISVAQTERTKEVLIRALVHQHGAITKK